MKQGDSTSGEPESINPAKMGRRGFSFLLAGSVTGRKSVKRAVAMVEEVGTQTQPQIRDSGSWPMSGHDVSGSAYSPSETGPSGSSGTVWEAKNLQCSPPVVSDGAVYFGMESGVAVAVEALSGSDMWEYNASNRPILATPATDGENAYFIDQSCRLYCIDTGGDQRWSTKVEGTDPTDLAVGRRGVYFGTDEAIYSVSTVDGSTRWKYDTNERTGKTPVIQGNLAYLADGGDAVALSNFNGSFEWSTYIGGSTEFVASDSDYLYVCAGLSLIAYGNEGDEIWSLGISGNAAGTPAVGDGTVYVATESGVVNAFDTSTGSSNWSKEVGREALGGPSVGGGTVYVLTTQGFQGDTTVLKGLDAETGSGVMSHELGASASGRPAISDGTAYIGTDSGVYAVGDNNIESPTASIEVAPTEPVVGDPTTLDGSESPTGSFSIERYEWKVEKGDSSAVAEGEVVERVFPEGGEWTVQLTVTDSAGQTDTNSDIVNVHQDEGNPSPEGETNEESEVTNGGEESSGGSSTRDTGEEPESRTTKKEEVEDGDTGMVAEEKEDKGDTGMIAIGAGVVSFIGALVGWKLYSGPDEDDITERYNN